MFWLPSRAERSALRRTGGSIRAAPQTSPSRPADSMTQPPFLDRKTFGLPHYLWVAMAFAFFVAMVPGAARRALHSNTNRAEDWLPDTYTESKELKWFRRHFISEGFVLVTWDGCTLGNADKLQLLEHKLSERIDPTVKTGAADSLRAKVTAHTGKWFRKILSGPSMLEELTSPPLSLSYSDAIRRLEGALVGPPQTDAEGKRLDDATRITCLVVYLSPEGYEDNHSMRNVVRYIQDVALRDCDILAPQLHMGGPIVDNVAIDQAGEGSLVRLASLSGLVGLAIAYGCLRNLRLTMVVVAVGAISAMVSLALVDYFGVIEQLVMHRERRLYGTMDAILMSMPALVYVLGVSGAIHFVNYYREARLAKGATGAVERAVRGAWIPCSLVALTAAIGFGSLVTSDIVPIQKFGGFSAAGIVATLGVLFSVLPVYLHRFPPSQIGRHKWDDIQGEDSERLPDWGAHFYRWLAQHNGVVTCVLLGIMLVAGIGLLRLKSSVRLLKLLDDKADLVQDYIWVEHHMGNLVPMEVVLTIPPEKFRSGDEHAEDGRQYRMTMLERLNLVRSVVARIEALDEVSRTLSAATLGPDESQGTAGAGRRRGGDYSTNKKLEERQDSFRDYLQKELLADGKAGPASRELWRISARVTALKDIDYGLFTNNLSAQVEPVLAAYRRRDLLIQELNRQGKTLKDSRLCVIFRGDPEKVADTAEGLLFNLLKESAGVLEKAGELPNPWLVDMARLSQLTPEAQAKALARFREYDAVLVASDSLREDADRLAADGVKIVDVTKTPVDEMPVIAEIRATDGPRPVRSLYTGIIPLVFKTQRQLLFSLRSSLFSSGVLIVLVMAIVFRSVMAGAISMLPNLFPVLLVFGTLGLLGIKMDIGIVMTASVALGVAVDSTVHLVTWFYLGQAKGLDRRGATLMAYEHCATATVQGAMISGLGLAVFAASSFTPTRQFGYLMITIQSTALLGDLVLLPALLCGPLGKFFERKRRAHAKSAIVDEPAADLPIVEGFTAEIETPADAISANGDRSDNGHTPQQTARRTADAQPLNSPAHTALRDKLRSFRRH
ncbi:MAG: MMPL family transporter [Pirellulales bacterium]